MNLSADLSKYNIDEKSLNTPMMNQYLNLKEQYKDSILLFRMGDFYELFLEDAIIAAPIMEVVVTKRQNSIPMAGVPYHSADTYIQKLLDAGYKVSIAEQDVDLNNPKLLERKVKRLLTPGTLIEEKFISSSDHNYLMSFIYNFEVYAFALCDVSTGDFITFEIKNKKNINQKNSNNINTNSVKNSNHINTNSIKNSNHINTNSIKNSNEELIQIFYDYYIKFRPKEILVTIDTLNLIKHLPEKKIFVPIEAWKASPTEGRNFIKNKFGKSLKGLGFPSEWNLTIGAVGMILHYINDNFPKDQNFLLQAPVYKSLENDFMLLDEKSISNLDIISNKNELNHYHTLFNVLDNCHTSVGKRFLKENLILPLKDKAKIEQRQNIVEKFLLNNELLEKLIFSLSKTNDLERVLARLNGEKGNIRDIISTINTIKETEVISKILKTNQLNEISLNIPETLLILIQRIENEITEEPPTVLNISQPFIKDGINNKLDEARKALSEGGNWIINFEANEKEKTGISTLKVKYHKFSGYYIEVSRMQAKSIPSDYYRKQTLTNYERFSNPRLLELEEIIGNAEETVNKIEEEYFRDYSKNILLQTENIKKIMFIIAELDFLTCLAIVAFKKKWIKPCIKEKAGLELIESYHPIVEHFLNLGEQFTPNDLILNQNENLAIITGPNMAGKSTFIRQAAIIQILAQIGSFVPAKVAVVGICDQILTRIGSGDNLTRGESTFYTEMLEAARILNQANSNTLVIMDEVGRGTSTDDGLALAWSMAEYLNNEDGKKPLTLFATHYHQLSKLENGNGIFNLTVDVLEDDGQIIFLHKVKRGVADRSYGIYVAELAGIPNKVIKRAKEILANLEKDKINFNKTINNKINNIEDFTKVELKKDYIKEDNISIKEKNQKFLF